MTQDQPACEHFEGHRLFPDSCVHCNNPKDEHLGSVGVCDRFLGCGLQASICYRCGHWKHEHHGQELESERIERAVAAEREECAKIADRVADSKDSRDAELIARDIRARGSK